MPYSLYRPSVPVQYSYTSTTLRAVRSVGSLSALQYSYTSTTLRTVRFVVSLSACTVQLYLYSPYGPYRLYRPQVPVQYSYTSTTLRVVRPVESLSACTEQLNLYHP